MKLIPLGTNGYFPSFNRQSACYLVLGLKELLILDAGSGMFRFAEASVKKILNNYKEIHIFLSHYHLDHTFGFYAAYQFFKDKKVKVFGRQERQIFWEFVKLKHFPVEYARVHANFSWRTLKEGWNNAGDYIVSSREQYHRGEGSLAYRFQFDNGRSLAYLTDTEPNLESVNFVKEVDLLLHEHDSENENSKYREGVEIEKLFNGAHTTTAGAAMIAKSGNVSKLGLIHHNAFMSNKELNQDEKQAKKLFRNSFLARDMEEINF